MRLIPSRDEFNSSPLAAGKRPPPLMRRAMRRLSSGMRTIGAALTLCAIAGAAAADTPVLPTTAQGWSDAARHDVDEAYAQFAANHPGMYDKANPKFPGLLKAARAKALALVPKVTDAAGYQATLQSFSVTLGDGHAQVAATLPAGTLSPTKWPGFIAAWRGDRLLVYASEPGGPPQGATILACDGKPTNDLIVSNVFAYQGRVNEAGQWWSQARNLFTDWGNPFVTRPSSCDFSLGGHTTTLALTWRDSDDTYLKWRTDSYNGEVLPIGVTEPKPGLLWLAMPSFQPDAAGRDAYAAMYKEINDHRDRFLNARAIVIDLRNNQGGSSEWSDQAAEALWGKDRADRRINAYFASTHVRWRASKANADYVVGMVKTMRDQNRAAIADEFDPIARGLKTAADQDKTWFDEADDPAMKPVADPERDRLGDPPALSVTVYVIVPGQCASACDDALDYFTRFPNTKLIGAPSSADSTYLEVRTQPAPSGLARVIIPNKVYIGRPRAGGEVYRPAIVNASLSWSTQSFIDLIEADLIQQK